MTSRQLQLAIEAFDAVSEAPPEQREAYLAGVCDKDREVFAEVMRLLVANDQAEAEGFLAQPAVPDFSHETTGWEGRRVGSYNLSRKLGSGGMGVVYLAVRADDVYLKEAAVKFLWPELQHGIVGQRFDQERRILAALNHPNIARLLDGGVTNDGMHYFVMEYVDGQPITDYCNALGLSVAERLKLFRTVCSAVQYAHQNLIVHRDLKPGNILVTADGASKLLDFGVAKLLAPDATDRTPSTLTGQRPMTPEYASPEQLRGEAITTVSDVYALGVLLYELLTGAHPYPLKQRSLPEMIRLVCEEDPPPPSARQAQLRGDLDHIILLALHKDVGARYQTVEQLSEDIERHLDGKPVQARRATLTYRLGKFARRNKTGVAVTATALLLLLAALLLTLWQNRQQRFQLYAADMRQAGENWAEGNLAQMDALLEAHRPGVGDDPWRSFEWFSLWKLLHTEKFILRHELTVPAVIYTPDGKTILTGGSGLIEKWDAQTGRPLGLFAASPSDIYQLKLFREGTRLIVNSGPGGQLSVWDYPNQRKLFEVSIPSSNFSRTLYFTLSPDETKLVASRAGPPFQMWDATTGQLLGTYTAPPGLAIPEEGPAIFSPDGRLLCLAVKDRQFELWDLMTRRMVVRLDPQSDDPRALLPFNPIGHIFSHDGARYYLPTEDFRIRVWDSQQGGKPLHVFTGHQRHIEIPALSHDDKLLASGSDDRTLRLWDTQTGKLLVTVKNESQTFGPVFSPDDQFLAAVVMRALRTKVWDVNELLSAPQVINGAQTLGLIPDGKLLTVSKDGESTLLDLRTGRELLTFNQVFLSSCNRYDCAKVSADGSTIALRQDLQAGSPGVVIRDAATEKVLAELSGHAVQIAALAFSPNGKLLATGGDGDGLIKLWDTATWREGATLRGHTGKITSLDFSADGGNLASSGYDRTVRIWSAPDGKELFTVRYPGSWAMKTKFSPDGKLLASSDFGSTIKLWDVATGREIRTLKGHANSIYALAFSPDGRRLASGSDDQTVRLWDVQTGTELTALRGHSGEVWQVFFTADGKTLISSGEDGTRVWRTATEEDVYARTDK